MTAVGDQSPAEAEALREWLVGLPDQTILRSRSNRAWQREDYQFGDGKTRHTLEASGGSDVELSPGNTRWFADRGPFTVVWLPTAPDTDSQEK